MKYTKHPEFSIIRGTWGTLQNKTYANHSAAAEFHNHSSSPTLKRAVKDGDMFPDAKTSKHTQNCKILCLFFNVSKIIMLVRRKKIYKKIEGRSYNHRNSTIKRSSKFYGCVFYEKKQQSFFFCSNVIS